MAKWNKYRGGRGWRVLEDNRILCADLPQPAAKLTAKHHADGYLYRTPGEPASMWQLYQDYASLLEEASERFRVPRCFLMACIGIEASRLKTDALRFDPKSIRFEDGYRSDEKTPHRVSPGMMQTLLSTAREMNARYGVLRDVSGVIEVVDRHDLWTPRYSILLGAAYMRHQMQRLEPDEEGFDPEDPILNVVAAYNAGSVRIDPASPWRLKTYSRHRIDRFCAWNNDAIEVLQNCGRRAA